MMPPLAILAGGLATRMRPLTATIPKSLLDVGGEPFIFHQLRLLRRQNITRVVLCVGHLGEQIRDAVGDGAAFGLDVTYSFDGPRLRGTGGALRAARPLLGETFWVMYGDSYLDIDFAPVHRHFLASGQPALMTVLRNLDRWDRSNVIFADGRLVLYDKQQRDPAMHHIDYGLSLLTADILAAQPDEEFDLAPVFANLSRANKLAGYEVTTRFYEIGSPEGLRETILHLQEGASA